jgi:hypothetical protein
LRRNTGRFECIAAPSNGGGKDLLSLADVVKAFIIQKYDRETLLNLVAVTDGTREIRDRLFAIFGATVMMRLDWYHLCKKLRQLMTKITVNKIEETTFKVFISLIMAGKNCYCFRVFKTSG